jgi:quinol monooxygenase YgiN
MSISLLAAAAGVVIALAGTIALAIRCVRMPRADLIAWTCAMFGLAVALAAQAAGFATGFGPVMFRAGQLGAQVVATLGLALGLAEVAASSLPVRFAARLAVSALGVVSLVILATDPLGTTAFSKAFPVASAHYQPIPNSLLMYVLAPFTALVALIAIFVTAGRSRRDPAWRATFPGVTAAGVAALALAAPGLAALASNRLHIQVSLASAFPVLCILAAALTWLAVSQVRRIRLDVVHQEDAYGDEDDEDGWARGRSWAGGDETGDYDPLTSAGGGRYAADSDQVRYAGDQGYGDYVDDAGYEQPGRRAYADDAGYGAGGDGAGGGYPAGSGYGADDRYPAAPGGAYEDAGLPGSAGLDGAVPAGAMPGGVPAGLAPPGTDSDEIAQGNRPGIWQPAGAGDAGLPGMPPGPPGMPPGVPGVAGIPPGMLPPQPGLQGGQPGLPEADDQEAWSRLFGQIAIYTLLEDRVDAFDGLTEEVVELVRAREPDTLVYIVHAVPSAPMQRILYEVYRDREAYEEHRHQPYIAKFEVDRRPYVLATNVIELGLQRAKVSPIPTVPDLLSRPGGEPPGAAPAVPGGSLSPGAPGGPLGAAMPGGPEGSGPASLGHRPQRLP